MGISTAIKRSFLKAVSVSKEELKISRETTQRVRLGRVPIYYSALSRGGKIALVSR
jgi:hypothetical protein